MDLLSINDRKWEYPESYYASTTEDLGELNFLEPKSKVDVCVVGAGYTGLSSAICLAERGYTVKILEAQRVGFGASGRNGGQVGSGQRWDQRDIEKYFGSENADKYWNIGEDAKAEVRQRISNHNISCDYRSGVIYSELKEKNVPDYFRYVEYLKTKNHYHEIEALDRKEVSELTGTNIYKGGSLDVGAGHLNPLKYAFGLAKAALDLGVIIHERSKVTSIEYGSKDNLVKVDNGRSVKARFIILACNGYLGKLESKIASKVMPINNFIIATEPLSEDLYKSILQKDHAVADSKFVVNYFKKSPDQRLIFGGGENYSYKFPKNMASRVRNSMLEVYPGLETIGIDFAWGGTLGISLNRLPVFKRLSATVFSASGYSGHGVALATFAGRIISDAIIGQVEKFDLMEKMCTKSFPGGASFRWPLMALAMFWYSLRDRL